jgi:hypothetical protein
MFHEKSVDAGHRIDHRDHDDCRDNDACERIAEQSPTAEDVAGQTSAAATATTSLRAPLVHLACEICDQRIRINIAGALAALDCGRKQGACLRVDSGAR